MADRNTRIRGSQILDGTVTEFELNASVAGAGLSGGAGSPLAIDLNELSASVVDVSADSIAIVDATDNTTKKEAIADIVSAIAGNGIVASAGVLSINVDDVTIEIASGEILQVKDGGIDEPKLAMNNSPSAGYVIAWNVGGYMEWVAQSATPEGYVEEAEISLEDESANCDGLTTVFNITSEPVVNSVQVFLNGLLQQEGSGKDYVLNAVAKTITFADAPETGDILLIHYINT